MPEVTEDLNNVIASAVQARIEAEVIKAMSGSEVVGQFVAAALNQRLTVRENYTDRKTTYMAETIRKSVQEATRAAVSKAIEAEAPAIEAEVAKQIRGSVKTIAKGLTESVTAAAKSSYYLKVNVDVEPRSQD